MQTSILYVLCAAVISVQAAPELQFLQIIFAHKPYAPISAVVDNENVSFPANLTYEHFDFAPFNMPNEGKLNMYNLGVHLRDVYDGFLGENFTSRVMKVRTAEYPLSIMSAQLVNAGLWPPSERDRWNDDLNWQPIPSDYVTAEEDTLLLGQRCPSFRADMKEVLTSDGMKPVMLHHSPLFNFVSNHSGIEIDNPSEITLLYAVLETKASLNESLPYWAEDIFPDGGMYNVTLLQYDLLSQTPLQRQLNGGTLIKEMLTNTIEHIDGRISEERKLMMYSGNDRNIAGLLKSLDLWSPHIPNEAAAVIFETYFDNETEHYGIKINYYTGVEGDTIPLTVPNCTEICPLDTFLDMFFDLIPANAVSLCHRKKIQTVNLEIEWKTDIYNRSESHKPHNVIFIFLFVLVLFTY
ncbi:venom acid phosphatase Acph-1 [Nomia melanderi]|uniref:venom acid phosphatase Acph-1 n=1 Tax=Nomia melanderi TaxID=2448451 RepID=UPI0013045A60|nr:venom acid phosphatase Acph-1-like [Nomia melanderi]XP_031828056.1 venom acid phosphatase Acph-1-like [Nomia melanderi]